MSTTRTVARGTLRLLAGQLSARALDFTLYLLLARRLGVTEFGRYTFAFSFTALFSVLADLGLSTVFVREASRAPQRVRALLARTLELKVGCAAVTLLAVATIAWLSGSRGTDLGLISLFTVALLFNSSAMLFEGLLRSAGRAGTSGLSLLIQSATGLAAGATLLWSGAGALGGVLAWLAAAVAHLAAATWNSRSLWSATPAPEAVDSGAGPRGPGDPGPLSPAMPPSGGGVWRERFALLRESAPLALGTVFIAVYFRVDSVLLHGLKGAAAVGLYGAVYRLFESTMMFSAAFRSVLFPVMARAADGPDASLGVLCRKSIRVQLLFTVGLATFVTCRSREIVSLVLGDAYASAAPALVWLAWALPGAFVADTLYHLLVAQRRQALGTGVVSLVAAANLTMNLALIPRYSLLGAAASTAVAEALCAALLFAAFRQRVRVPGLARPVAAPFVAAGALAGTLTLAAGHLPSGPLGLLLAGLTATAAYAATLAAVGGLVADDARLARELLPASGWKSAQGPEPADR